MRRSSTGGPIINPDLKLKPVKAHLDLYLRDLVQLCPGIELPKWYREAVIGPAEYIAEELLLEEVEVARLRTEALRQHASQCLLGNRRIYDSVWLATEETEHADKHIASTAKRARDCNAKFLDRQLQQHTNVTDLCIEAGSIHPLFAEAIAYISKVARCDCSVSPLKSPVRGPNSHPLPLSERPPRLQRPLSTLRKCVWCNTAPSLFGTAVFV